MPNRPRSICRFPPCNRKTSDTYCKSHKHHDKSYSNKSSSDPWYNHKIWRGSINKPFGQRGGMRERQLLKVPYCIKCKEEGVIKDITKGGIVDHIIPFRSVPKERQWHYFTDPENHQSLCKTCHNEKSASDRGYYN